MSLVLDASMAVAWLFEDETNDATREVLRTVAVQGAEVPSLWHLEVANVLRNAARRGRCHESYVDQSLGRLGRLPITVDDQTVERAWDATLTLAREAGLTLYDAAYLELAQRRQLPLATLDTALVAAAAQRNVAVLGG